MLHRHFSEVTSYPGLCLELHTQQIMDQPQGDGSFLILQEHPDEMRQKSARTCSCQIVAGISRVDPQTRKFPLSSLETLLESCANYGRESGRGPDEVRVMMFQGASADGDYRLRVIKSTQKENPGEIRLGAHNLADLKERIIAGEKLSQVPEMVGADLSIR